MCLQTLELFQVSKTVILQGELKSNEKTLGVGDFTREGDCAPLQYSCLENPMGRGAWWAAVHGVAKSQAQLNDFTFTFYFLALEKEMATHSSVLSWRSLVGCRLWGHTESGTTEAT